MLEINTRILKLDELYPQINVGTIMSMIDEMNDAKAILEGGIEHFNVNLPSIAKNLKDIMAINLQLYYINLNLTTLEDALLCYESKIFEKFSFLTDIQPVCLN